MHAKKSGKTDQPDKRNGGPTQQFIKPIEVLGVLRGVWCYHCNGAVMREYDQYGSRIFCMMCGRENHEAPP